MLPRRHRSSAVARGAREQPAANALARIGAYRGGRCAEREVRSRLAQLGEILPARQAGGHVREHRRALIGVECVDRERAKNGEGFVVTHLASHRVSSRKTANRSRSFCIANRIRVFTVPSGCPVCSAISVWLSPPKYPSSNACRCSSGKSAKAASTKRRRSACSTASDGSLALLGGVSSRADDADSNAPGSSSDSSCRRFVARRRSSARLRAIVSSH